MAGRPVHRFGAVHPGVYVLDEPESPRPVGRVAVYFVVEKVTHPDESTAYGHGNHHPIQRPQVGHPVLPRKEPQTDEESYGRSVARHAAVAEGQQLERIGQIVPRFVKQAVAQAGADDGGQCPVNEYRVGELCGKPLSLAELYEKEGSEPDGDGPHHAVPADVERPYSDECGIEVPDYRKKLVEHLLYGWFTNRRGTAACS